MGNKTLLIVLIVIVLAVIGFILFRSPEAEAPTAGDAVGGTEAVEEAADGDMSAGAGSYEPYDAETFVLADKSTRVLFFRAGWCPTCRTLDGDIRANLDKIPENITIIDVNYDTETALKQRYGVTYQHTLVQVDAAGNTLAKWSGSPTLASLLAQVR